MDRSILLIHAPVAKACEAPGGLTRLAGSLRRYGVACRIWDANLEGQLWMMGEGKAGAETTMDAWTRRAAKHLEQNLAALRSRELYRNHDRYRRAVMDLNRLLTTPARSYGIRLSLADYEDERLSPVQSADLLHAAEEPQGNPFYPWFSERLRELIIETRISHVGFSLNYLSQTLTTFAMIGFIRTEFPKIRIVIGGGLVTSWSRLPNWKYYFTGILDALISGPGEAPLLTLLGRQHDGGADQPDFEGLPMTDYLSPGMVIPYSGSSGCWWQRCSFCPERIEGNPYRPLPFEQVTSDLRNLVVENKPALIHFLDNALSPALLGALTVNPPGSPWYGFARLMPCLADPDFCLKLRDSGCVMLKLGLESGDAKVLEALNKGIDLATASVALKNLKSAGIATYVYLLFGTPAETAEAAGRTLAFTAEHADEITFLNLAIFNLPAHGSENNDFDTENFYAGDLSLYRAFAHPLGWNRGEVRGFLEREFKRRPVIAEILRRNPPLYTSNHAPFLAMNRETHV